MAIGDERVLVVIPAFNEELSVADVVAEVRRKSPFCDVLVVDDGSTDATSIRAAEAGALVATLPFNLGVGGAMRTGYRFAFQHGYDIAIQVDADGQHDPASIPALVAALGAGDGADLVLGARFAGEGDYRVRGPRAWAMRVLAAILSRSARTRLTDTTSGFRAAGRRAIALFAEHYPAEYLGDTIEALVIASRRGLVIRQVPVAMRARVAGTPSHGFAKSAIYLARAGIALVFAYLRPRSAYREALPA